MALRSIDRRRIQCRTENEKGHEMHRRARARLAIAYPLPRWTACVLHRAGWRSAADIASARALRFLLALCTPHRGVNRAGVLLIHRRRRRRTPPLQHDFPRGAHRTAQSDRDGPAHLLSAPWGDVLRLAVTSCRSPCAHQVNDSLVSNGYVGINCAWGNVSSGYLGLPLWSEPAFNKRGPAFKNRRAFFCRRAPRRRAYAWPGAPLLWVGRTALRLLARLYASGAGDLAPGDVQRRLGVWPPTPFRARPKRPETDFGRFGRSADFPVRRKRPEKCRVPGNPHMA
jgi:hypothetical protein